MKKIRAVLQFGNNEFALYWDGECNMYHDQSAQFASDVKFLLTGGSADSIEWASGEQKEDLIADYKEEYNYRYNGRFTEIKHFDLHDNNYDMLIDKLDISLSDSEFEQAVEWYTDMILEFLPTIKGFEEVKYEIDESFEGWGWENHFYYTFEYLKVLPSHEEFKKQFEIHAIDAAEIIVEECKNLD